MNDTLLTSPQRTQRTQKPEKRKLAVSLLHEVRSTLPNTTAMRPNDASYRFINAALRVHASLGAGLLESAIHACLIYELTQMNLGFDHEVRLPVVYKQVTIPAAYRVDFIIEHCLLVEIKCVEQLRPVHTAQMLTYLKLSGFKLGLLINFNVPHLRQGIRRVINGPEDEL